MILYFDGTNVIFGADTSGSILVIGSSINFQGKMALGGSYGSTGQVLSSNGSGSVPTWKSISVGTSGNWTASPVTVVIEPLFVSGTGLMMTQADATHDGWITYSAFNSWGAKYGYGDSPIFTDVDATQVKAGNYKSSDDSNGVTYGLPNINPNGEVYKTEFKNGLYVGLVAWDGGDPRFSGDIVISGSVTLHVAGGFITGYT
jgi:hypothetical protein